MYLTLVFCFSLHMAADKNTRNKDAAREIVDNFDVCSDTENIIINRSL